MPLEYCPGHRFECFNCVYSFEDIENLTDEIPKASETYLNEKYKNLVRISLVETDSSQHVPKRLLGIEKRIDCIILAQH